MSCDGILCVAKNRRNLSNVLTDVLQGEYRKILHKRFSYNSRKLLRVQKTRLFTIRVCAVETVRFPHSRGGRKREPSDE